MTAHDNETVEMLTQKVFHFYREMAWKNVHILERARQEQDKKLKELENKYTQCCQDRMDLQGQLASAEALIETLQEQLK